MSEMGKAASAIAVPLRAGGGWALRAGGSFFELLRTARGLGAFFLISLGVGVTKRGVARGLIYPMARREMARVGVKLLPMVAFMSVGMGFLIIGQAVSILTRVGAQDLTGSIMVAVVVRELGPAVTALLMLTKVGTGAVVELGTARALGEVEALEALGIDPVHYLVIPRIVGMALSNFALTIYCILMTLAGGYFVAFLQNVPLAPGVYVEQIARSLQWIDFVLVTLKTLVFGGVIAMTCCYEGLAQPLRLAEVSEATTRAVMTSVVLCVFFDAIFLLQMLI